MYEEMLTLTYQNQTIEKQQENQKQQGKNDFCTTRFMLDLMEVQKN